MSLDLEKVILAMIKLGETRMGLVLKWKMTTSFLVK